MCRGWKYIYIVPNNISLPCHLVFAITATTTHHTHSNAITMDSMRSLNTSLPGTSPPKVGEPPEQLLTAFKAAALSVTQLYKTATADQGKARAEGYEDALYELLDYMDKEDIGLGDGEGWRIRRWATERMDSRDSAQGDSDDEIGAKQDRARDRGSSPEIHRSQSTPRLSSTSRTSRMASPARASPPPPTSDQSHIAPPVFTFRAGDSLPRDADFNIADVDMSENTRTLHEGTVSHASNPPITVTRAPRTGSRHSTHSGRSSIRNGNQLPRNSVQKRKATHDYGEFFDILSSGCKDGSGGGGKRGRFA